MKLLAGLSIPLLFLWALLGVLLGAGGYTLYYAEGLSYLSDDPKTCVNCHVMREHHDGWQKASHHAVATCNDCHLPHDTVPKYLAKAKNGFFHSKGFTLQDFHEPIRIHESNARSVERNCIECHQDLVREIVEHSGSTGERLHCVRCHENVGHGPSR